MEKVETEREFHAIANLFPMMSPDEFDALKADIAENGQREMICVHPDDGSIIDGRNRYVACREIGIEPQVYEWSGDGSLVSFVVSLNLHRRHLSPSQGAAVSLAAEEMLAEELKKNQSLSQGRGQKGTQIIADLKGEARDHAAKMFGTNRQYVSDAKKLKAEHPIEFEKVRTGEKTIPEAKRDIRDAAKGARREELRTAAEALGSGKQIPNLADVTGQYRTVYLDPPWAYDDSTVQGAAAHEYNTMTVDAMVEDDQISRVPDLLNPEGGHVWMWTTWPMIREGSTHCLLDAWGLAWKSEVTWDKDKLLLGRWLRKQTEICILAVKGDCPRLAADVRDIIREPSGAHSTKPGAMYRVIERFSPGPRIELFARSAREGWDRWGNQA